MRLKFIDAHGLKIQGEGPWGFDTFGEGGYRGCQNFFWEGTPFWGFIAFYEQVLWKFRREGPILSSLTPHVCIYGLN
jgi:hypothetical protein